MWQVLFRWTIRQYSREWDNGKTGKGSKQQQKDMTADDRKWLIIIPGTSQEVGNWNGEELVFGTW